MKKPIVTHRQVRYIVGWRDRQEGVMHEVFVTDSSEYASRWCRKFNTFVVKYKEFLKQFEHEEPYNYTLKEKYEDDWYMRWSDIQNVGEACVLPLDYREGCYYGN